MTRERKPGHGGPIRERRLTMDLKMKTREELLTQVQSLSSELSKMRDLQQATRSEALTAATQGAELDVARSQRAEAERIGRAAQGKGDVFDGTHLNAKGSDAVGAIVAGEL